MNRNKLAELSKTKTRTQLAEIFSVSRQTIVNYQKMWGIEAPSRDLSSKREFSPLVKEEWLGGYF